MATLAIRQVPLLSALSVFQPAAQLPFRPIVGTTILDRIRASAVPASLSWSVGAFSGLSGILSGIWEGILRAVPKKKTSHMKKRHRQMAGKALKDVTALVKCSSCGRTKRAHVLCPYCVQTMREWFGKKMKGNAQPSGLA